MNKVSSKYKALLDSANAFATTQKQNGIKLTPELVRMGVNAFAQFSLPKVVVEKVIDSNVIQSGQKIPVRIYDPAPEEEKPVQVIFHGGHMCGDIELYDGICRRLASTNSHLVVSVEYRLAPQAPYPQGLEDGQTVISQLDTLLTNYNVDLDNITLVGDSAGGALATTLAWSNKHISNLVLFYPSLDYTFSTESYKTYASGYLLETEKVRWYFDHYFTENADRRAASPLFYPELSQMPRTLILAAELDPLVDEGKLFHENLASSGIECHYHEGQGLIHSFINLEILNPSLIEQTYRTVAEFLNYKK